VSKNISKVESSISKISITDIEMPPNPLKKISNLSDKEKQKLKHRAILWEEREKQKIKRINENNT